MSPAKTFEMVFHELKTNGFLMLLDSSFHQSLWPAFFGIVAERQTWQTKLLSPAAKKILKKSDKSALQTKDISDMEPKERSAVIAELEKKLLVHSRQIHTESGKHERVLQSWESLIA